MRSECSTPARLAASRMSRGTSGATRIAHARIARDGRSRCTEHQRRRRSDGALKCAAEQRVGGGVATAWEARAKTPKSRRTSPRVGPRVDCGVDPLRKPSIAARAVGLRTGTIVRNGREISSNPLDGFRKSPTPPPTLPLTRGPIFPSVGVGGVHAWEAFSWTPPTST